MFPLYTKSFPSTPSELSELLNASIQRVFQVEKDPVTLAGGSYPRLERIDINLDRGKLRSNPPRPPVVKSAATPGLHVNSLCVEATQLSIGPAAVDLRLTARDVLLEQDCDAAGEIVLVLRTAAEGEIETSIQKTDLEAAIAAVASHEAGKQGATIENVRLVLNARGPRSVSGEVQLKARKLFFSTVIRIAANLDLDDELNATISGLACHGDGAIGALACGVLSPHLQKMDGRTFPLMALPLGEIRLRDVRISAAEKITVHAQFGV